MLTIRREQMAVFAEEQKRAFETRLVRHVSAMYPEHDARLRLAGGEQAVRAFLQETIHRALSYAINDEYDITTFLELRLELGPDFERTSHAWALDILTAPRHPGWSKLCLIVDRLDVEGRQAAGV